MRRADYPEALAAAAAPALAAIEHDEHRAQKRLRPLFAAMRALLFNLDLDLERIQDAAGFADGEVFSDLREEVGQPAWSYLRDARLETAARLLLATPISIAEIGYLVGYGSAPSFRQLLRSFLGMPPSQYRRRAPRLLERAGPPPPGAGTDEYWRRMLAGELSAEEARELDVYLERLAPESDPADDPADRWARLRRTLAEGFAYTLESLPFAEQRRLVRDAVWFPDGTFFELLSRRGREHEDPERGVELALLAIDSLAANHMLETDPGRAALAWARLALARWLTDDLSGAEQDLERSAGDVERARGEDPVSWTAERSRVAAAFHWHRGRRRQALELAVDSVAAHRAARPEELAKALVLRAELRAASADLGNGEGLQAALEDVEEARDLLRGSPKTEQAAAFSLWLRILVRLGDHAELAVALPQARRAAPGFGEPSFEENAAALLPWFEGHCAGTPEPSWREARERFAALGDELWVARTTLDLARLCLAEERASEASALAAELASALGAPAASPEDLAALKALARAAAPAAEVASADLDRAEQVLKRFEWDRRARRALDLAR